MRHFIAGENLNKAIGAFGSPYFKKTSVKAKEIPVSALPDEKYGPRGGHIKEISPTTGKPIYYKKWSYGQGITPHPVAPTGALASKSAGYEPYSSGGVIGRTRGNLPIHAGPTKENTQSYSWRDHKDAHQAHFALAQYLMNLVQKAKAAGKDASSINKMYEKHMEFARHHQNQSVLDMLHGKTTASGEEDLASKE